MHRIASVLAVALAAACGGSAPATETPASTAEVGPAEAEAEATPAAAAPVATLLELVNGDRACYVELRLEDGTETSIEGDFELCAGGAHDATALIGQQVTYTTERRNVLAAECEGDMDCGKSDEVDLVLTITAAP